MQGGKVAVNLNRRNRKTDSQPSVPSILHSPFPELVFGLIGPAGTDLKFIFKTLKKCLEDVGYRVPKQEIRLSSLIEEFLEANYGDLPEGERVNSLMTAGTTIREKSENGGAVAWLGISGIAAVRESEFNNTTSQNAYILHSLKHPEEIEALRTIYGKGFFAISAYSPREVRVTALANRITKSKHLDSKGSRAQAEALIERDELEEGKKFGQNVKDAFPQADLFVDTSDKTQLQLIIKRFVEAIFEYPYHSPTKDEYGMYLAKSAALRSCDLARQVGAAILTEEGDLISVGCNDVPKAGGGLYWTGDQPDGRDFQLGNDASNEQREHILAELLSRLEKDNLLSNKTKDINKLVESLLVGNKKHVLKGSQILGLIEFGRSVHAEMAALMDASRRGVSVRDASLYTTTFPCHLCAKHIIASGIKRVIYVEPYPKSKAFQLYSDSITVDSTKPIEGRLAFEPFVGIAPRQYLELFQMKNEDSRKDKLGKTVDWPNTSDSPTPRLRRFLNTYQLLETKIIAEYIPEVAKAVGIKL